MIPRSVEVFVGLDPIDLRWGFDRLAGIASEYLGRDARSGALFVFFGRRQSAVKVLFFDGTGMCMLYKRLDRGAFQIPTAPPGARSITIEQYALDALFDGIELAPKPRARRGMVH